MCDLVCPICGETGFCSREEYILHVTACGSVCEDDDDVKVEGPQVCSCPFCGEEIPLEEAEDHIDNCELVTRASALSEEFPVVTPEEALAAITEASEEPEYGILGLDGICTVVRARLQMITA